MCLLWTICLSPRVIKIPFVCAELSSDHVKIKIKKIPNVHDKTYLRTDDFPTHNHIIAERVPFFLKLT